MATPEPHFIRPGLIIGDYHIDAPIGAGGMAEVWRAHRLSTGEDVAIKFLLKRFAEDLAIRSRFEREEQIRIDHPNVVQVQDFVSFDGRPAIVMKYYPSGSLEDRIRPPGFTSQPLPLADIWRISDQILSALDCAHYEHRVIHRDVKPANILLDQDGNAYLADFGIALDMDRYDVTRVGGELGTPSYMSPDQIKDPGKVTHLADVYSFSVVLFEMLTGRTPFEPDLVDSESYASQKVKDGHLHKPPPKLRSLNRRVSRLLEAIVLWGLAKKERQRIPGCRTFQQYLSVAWTGSPVTKVVKLMEVYSYLHAPAQRTRTVLRYAAASLVLTAAVLLAVNLWPERTSEPASPHPQNATTNPAGSQGASGGAGTVAHGRWRKRALLVGVDKYKDPSIRVLQAAGNDIRSMREVLIRNFEFASESIVVLEDAKATRDGILNEIQKHLIDGSGKDDIAVFYFTGHGSQATDDDGDEVGDGLDETMVAYDSSHETRTHIRDDELNAMFGKIAGKTNNLTVILDSCHSGTGLKDVTLKVKGIPGDELRPARTRRPASRPDTGGFGRDFNYAFIGASREQQKAFVGLFGKEYESVLTHYLTEALRRPNLRTYRDVMDVAATNAFARSGQDPQLEGKNTNQLVFGDSSRVPKPYFTITSGGRDRITLSGGRVLGMTEGSVFRIYPPGSIRLAPPERPLGTARISSVSTYESTAAVIEKTEIPVGSRAVEQQHRFGDARLRVYLTGPPGSPALSAVRQQLASEKYIELVEQPSRCQMQVRERNGRLETLTNGGFTMSTPLPVGSSDTPARLLEQLQEWAKWFTVLQVRDPGDGPAVQFELMSVRPDGDSPVSGLFMRPDSALKPEDKVQLVIKNNHEKSVYVTVLDMESTGRIQIAYPPDEGEAALLRAGNEIKHRRIMDVPPGRSFVTDTFKLIASSQQIDLRPLCRPEGIKSPDDVKMTEDLMNELLGQDSGAKGSRNELRPGEWATAQKTVLVRRR